MLARRTLDTAQAQQVAQQVQQLPLQTPATTRRGGSVQETSEQTQRDRAGRDAHSLQRAALQDGAQRGMQVSLEGELVRRRRESGASGRTASSASSRMAVRLARARRLDELVSAGRLTAEEAEEL